MSETTPAPNPLSPMQVGVVTALISSATEIEDWVDLLLDPAQRKDPAKILELVRSMRVQARHLCDWANKVETGNLG